MEQNEPINIEQLVSELAISSCGKPPRNLWDPNPENNQQLKGVIKPIITQPTKFYSHMDRKPQPTKKKVRFDEFLPRYIPSHSVKEFYPDYKLTTIKLARGAYQIVTSRIGLQSSEVSWQYSLLRNGARSHTWSLVPIDYNPLVIRPIALLETKGKNIALGEARITDLHPDWKASIIDLKHYYDSYCKNGTHIGFKVEEEYMYEWLLSSVPDKTGTKALLLWKFSQGSDTRELVAVVSQDPIITHPSDKSKLWCLEILNDTIPSHIALLSAFSIKERHSKISSLWAKKDNPQFCAAPPVVKYCFENSGSSASPEHQPKEGEISIRCIDVSEFRKHQLTETMLTSIKNEITEYNEQH